MDSLSFALEASRETPDGKARVGRLVTPHGGLDTPAFFPVGTYGAVRGVAPDELMQVGVQGVLSNTYHLHLRPGEDTIERLGGLHRFMGWHGPILTDSGGFQLYSLGEHLSQRDEEGVRFQSPIDGSARFLSPETCVAIQESLGADLVVQLDEFDPIAEGAIDAERVRTLMERTLRWGERCLAARTRTDQWLFGIVQGGASKALRTESAERTVGSGFPAFAIGGLGVGEAPERRWPLLRAALEPLPDDVPHYLMGLGTPDDLVQAIGHGVDLFDCVIPTRHGRHGAVFTADGVLHLRNARFREDAGPIERDCPCPVCARFSRAYLRHGLAAGEVLAQRLASLHNIAFYMRLCAQARAAIREDRWEAWRADWSARYGVAGESPDGSGDATHSAA